MPDEAIHLPSLRPKLQLALQRAEIDATYIRIISARRVEPKEERIYAD